MTEQIKNRNRMWIITLIVLVAILGTAAVISTVGFIMRSNSLSVSAYSLESIYQRSFYDLVDNINNTEVKIGKLRASADGDYQRKLLLEIHENANSAQNYLSYLPVSLNGIPETTKFINQLSGYTSTLSNTTNYSSPLSAENVSTFAELHASVKEVKQALNSMSAMLMNGYNITNAANSVNGDYNDFTTGLQEINANSTDYPTMIYDGPFSDSKLNSEIKGLPNEEVSEEEARALLEQYLNAQGTYNITYLGETNGKFQTYDYSLKTENNFSIYAQITKKGGKLLTISANSEGTIKNITKEEAVTKAEEFASSISLENIKAVWSEILGASAYINLAPIENNIIIYPDLIKVKVDLNSGTIIGWEASSYYANHVNRTLGTATLGATAARQQVENRFEIVTQKLTLIPLEYGEETLCYEFKCNYDDAVYYIYINANTGREENILRVIETQNGNLLM